MATLTTDLSKDDSIPYFVWDEPMTVGELRHRLATGSPAEVQRLLGRILREARDPDVWLFTTPSEVLANWAGIRQNLGLRKAFWEFLFGQWRQEGLLGHE